MGQRARLHRMFIIFRRNPSFQLPKWHFLKIVVSVLVFFCAPEDSYLGKLVQLFSLKQVNGKDSIGASSCFGQIPSFPAPKWHFLKIFVSVLFFLHQNLESHKVMKLFDSKWVSRQDSIGCSSFLAKFHRFCLRDGIFLKIFVFVLVFFYCAGIQIRVNLCSFSIGNGSMGKTPQDVHRLSAKSHRVSLENGIFLKIFISVLFFLFALELRFMQIC